MNVTGTQQTETLEFFFAEDYRQYRQYSNKVIVPPAIFPNFVFEEVQGLQEYLIFRKQLRKTRGGGGNIRGDYNRMNIFVSK